MGTIAGAFLLTLLLCVSAFAAEGDTVLVTIGEQVITEADFVRMVSVYGPDQARKILGDPRLKAETLRSIVEAHVLSRLAADKGFDSRDDIREGIELVKKTYIAREYLRREVTEKIVVTDKELEEYSSRPGKKHIEPKQATAEIRKEKIEAFLRKTFKDAGVTLNRNLVLQGTKPASPAK